MVELERDMLTIKGEPQVIFPKEGPGSFPNHEFFEASSIRKDGDKYIFVGIRRGRTAAAGPAYFSDPGS